MDTAVIVIPAAAVNDAVVACGAKGVATAVIITSGYAEMGNADLQAELVQTARRAGVRDPGAQHLRLLLPPQRPLRHLLHPL